METVRIHYVFNLLREQMSHLLPIVLMVVQLIQLPIQSTLVLLLMAQHLLFLLYQELLQGMLLQTGF